MKSYQAVLLVLLLPIILVGCGMFSSHNYGLDWDMPVEEQLQIEQENVAKEIVRSFEDIESITMEERRYFEEMDFVVYTTTVNGDSKIEITEGSGQMEQLSYSYHPDEINLEKIPHDERANQVSIDNIEIDYLTEEELDKN